MNIDFDRLDSLLSETGKSKAHLCRIVNRSQYYLRDVKKANFNIPRDIIERWANELNTTPEYLQGYTDVKEKPTAGAVGMNPIAREIINCLDGADEETLKRVLEVVRLFVENTK